MRSAWHTYSVHTSYICRTSTSEQFVYKSKGFRCSSLFVVWLQQEMNLLGGAALFIPSAVARFALRLCTSYSAHVRRSSGFCSVFVPPSFGIHFFFRSMFGRCSLRTLCSFGRCSVYVRCWGFQFLGGLIFLATLTTNNHRASQFFVRFIRYSFCGAIFFNVTGP